MQIRGWYPTLVIVAAVTYWALQSGIHYVIGQFRSRSEK
jgi:hypothetical protein